MRKLKQLILLVLYYGITRHLPEHSLPRGMLWCRLRRWTAGPLLKRCGKDVSINRGAHFGKGDMVSLGDRSSLGINARIVGEVTMGNDVGTAHNVFITASNREFSRTDVPIISQGKRPDAPVVIDDDVLILANVIILPGVHIHSGSIIGAGAVVAKDVPPFCIVAGNPARVVKWRKDPTPECFGPKMTPVAGDHMKPKA